ncbi:hypothetical protein D5278_18820 [bacterium 1XD21-13]|nr:hypothetical protein [bacterium 1XD21-13]
MKRKKLHVFGITLLAVLALVMVSAWTVKTSLAYFTTYETAKGSHELALSTQTTLHEEIKGMEKHVSVENTGGIDCYVRVKIFAGSTVKLSCAGDGWSQKEDGYWYYKDIVAPGASAGTLVVSITGPEDEDVETFNVVVIQECTPVLYDEDGNAYPDWTLSLDVAGKEAS